MQRIPVAMDAAPFENFTVDAEHGKTRVVN
jgi:hypothetical protein